MSKDIQKGIVPAIRVAPLGELRVYIISEEELNEFEQGSPTSLYLNFALALLASGFSFLAALLATNFASVKTFTVFVVLTVLFLLVGVILFANWYRIHRSSKSLARRIRDRMPPAPGIPEN
jgi:nucleoside recognition membrane protein YjiH